MNGIYFSVVTLKFRQNQTLTQDRDQHPTFRRIWTAWTLTQTTRSQLVIENMVLDSYNLVWNTTILM